jgi:hypothetical protein
MPRCPDDLLFAVQATRRPASSDPQTTQLQSPCVPRETFMKRSFFLYYVYPFKMLSCYPVYRPDDVLWPFPSQVVCSHSPLLKKPLPFPLPVDFAVSFWTIIYRYLSMYTNFQRLIGLFAKFSIVSSYKLNLKLSIVSSLKLNLRRMYI